MGKPKQKIRINDWLYLDDPNESELAFDRRFSVPITLAGAIFSFISIFGNEILHLNKDVIITTYISFAAYTIAYLLLYYNKYVKVVKYFIILFTILIINLIWYFDYGANGPVLYLFIILYGYLIFMLKGKSLVFFTIFIAVNLGVLFYLEYNYPHLISNYDTVKQHIRDVYFSTIFYGLIAFVIMYMAKTSYLQAYRGAKEADKLKTEFLENISHEIRTPLNAIIGFSSMLAMDEVSAEEKTEFTKYIEQSNQSIIQLVNDILDVSLIESEQLEIKNEEFNLTELMKGVEKKFRDKIEETKKAIELFMEMPFEELYLIGDALRLRQVMENLVDNAVKFTEKGRVTFGIKEQKESLYFFVKDTGIGFPPDVKEKIFDQFYKLSNNKEQIFRGTGMGLFISRKLVEAMGGTIGAQSEQGKGSLFFFTLPKNGFKKRAADYKNKPVKKVKQFPNLKTGAKPFSILVVDDNLSSQAYFKNLFKKMNVVVVLAGNGKEALELFEANRDFDLVLLDLRMPEMDGFETLKVMKEIDPSVLVVAQTAYVMNNYKERCLEAGFDEFIEKPVTQVHLLKILERFGMERNLS